MNQLNQGSVSFSTLLPQPESEWLDWKADFSRGLLADNTDPHWDNSRAKLLRAIVAVANTIYDRYGYVIYGVDDSTRPRSVRGISKHFDDADFQDWAQATFRPRVVFHYREETHDGKLVGIFEIQPSSTYPHVCERTIGDVLSDGQVWLRRGTRCTVAHHDDMRRMFEPPEPLVVSDPNGPVVRELRDIWQPLGWELYFPGIEEKADRIMKGHRLARLPGSRREIRFGNHVLLLRPIALNQ